MFKGLLLWMKRLCNQTGKSSLASEIKPEVVAPKPVPKKKVSVKKTQPVLAKKKPGIKKTVKK